MHIILHLTHELYEAAAAKEEMASNAKLIIIFIIFIYLFIFKKCKFSLEARREFIVAPAKRFQLRAKKTKATNPK